MKANNLSNKCVDGFVSSATKKSFVQLLITTVSFACYCVICMLGTAHAQLLKNKPLYTEADTLRGSLNANRNWWNVLKYDITVQPDFLQKTIVGHVVITSKAVFDGSIMQIDLQKPLLVDSIVSITHFSKKRTVYQRENFVQKDNVIFVTLENRIVKGLSFAMHIYYHGKPLEAKRAPWDGGWIWKKDAKGNPWMSVAVQGTGASAWYPCKDHQSDEPDNGATLTMIVPDTLIAIANGRLLAKENLAPNLSSYKWGVVNPINNYCIVPYIGKYTNFTDTLMGEKGKLDLSYWVLEDNLDKAKKQFQQVKPMLRAFEYWFGAYPFYEDGYKLVEAPHLGMEHQSAVAYGNQFKNGYLGMDRSGSGWGSKWDFIIIHESGHEWFANNITTNDIADMWVHESFTNYSETLFTEYYYGIQAGNEYNFGQRRNIANDAPIIGPYGVNKEGSGDMYDKGGNMLHAIRHAINNDEKFRQILRGLNKTFYHKTVNTKDIEDFISQKAGYSFQPVFNQYLRTNKVPALEYHFSEDSSTLYYRYSNCNNDFNLPVWVLNHKIIPTIDWQQMPVTNADETKKAMEALFKLYYLKVMTVSKP